MPVRQHFLSLPVGLSQYSLVRQQEFPPYSETVLNGRSGCAVSAVQLMSGSASIWNLQHAVVGVRLLI